MCAIGPAVVAQDLRAISTPGLARLGDIAVLISLGLPVVPLLGLLRLADQLLPAPLEPRPPQRLKTLLSQALVLVAIELCLLLAGLGLIQCLSWAVGQVSTTLAGLIVILGALIVGAGLFTQMLSLPLLVHHRCLLQACLQLVRLPRKVLLYSIRHAIDLDSPHLVVRLVVIAHELLVVIRVERLRGPPQHPEVGRQALPDVENDLGEVVLKMMILARARVLDTARQFQSFQRQSLVRLLHLLL